MKTQGKKTNDQKRGKTQATKSRLGIGWRLIGWEHGGASFLDQSETDLKQNQRNPGSESRNSIEKCFVYEQIRIIQILVIQDAKNLSLT